MDTSGRERLLTAIKRQGNELQKRSGWTQAMIERHLQIISAAQENIADSQKSIDYLHADVQAMDVALKVLREEYRAILSEGGNNGDSEEPVAE